MTCTCMSYAIACSLQCLPAGCVQDGPIANVFVTVCVCVHLLWPSAHAETYLFATNIVIGLTPKASRIQPGSSQTTVSLWVKSGNKTIQQTAVLTRLHALKRRIAVLLFTDMALGFQYAHYMSDRDCSSKANWFWDTAFLAKWTDALMCLSGILVVVLLVLTFWLYWLQRLLSVNVGSLQ